MNRLSQLSRRTKVILGLAAIPILCCCGLFAISLTQDTTTTGSEPTAENGEGGIPAEAIQPTQEEEAATDTAEPTNTARPTNTAEPTNSPRPPTNTPRPTSTAAPTSTPVPTPPPATNTRPPATNTRPPATATLPPAPTNTAVSLPTNTSAPLPTQEPAPAVCDCFSGDTLNCSDFPTHNAAQACYNYCWDLTGQDVHGLDGNDNDGLACESLP